LTGGIRNVFIWLPIIWEDRWYDSDFLLKMLEFKLDRMATRFEKHGIAVGAERDAKRMRICAVLCRHMMEDNYTFDEESNWKPSYFSKNKTWMRAKSRDAEYLGHLLGRYMLGWWD